MTGQRQTQLAQPNSVLFWALTCFVALVFVTGGSSRGDVQSLVVLRPLSIIVFGAACLTLKLQHIKDHKCLVMSLFLIAFLALLHLVPLPANVWHALRSNRELLEVDIAIQSTDSWRPITITPGDGWNAVCSLMIPMAVVALGIQLPAYQNRRLMPLLLLMCIGSALVGLVQIASGSNRSFYPYQITNELSAVGIFANRNHAATLLACLLPMLAVYVSDRSKNVANRNFLLWSALATSFVVIPLALITGSRSGLLLVVMGVISALLLYQNLDRHKKISQIPVLQNKTLVAGLTIFALSSLIAITILSGRAYAIERFFLYSNIQDSRHEIWIYSFRILNDFLPLGSGAGSLAAAYQLAELKSSLDDTYLNRAHNDWLEIAVTFGIPGIILLGGGTIVFIRQAVNSWWICRLENRPNLMYMRLAMALTAILAAASISDYPLRTPSMMCLASILALWISGSQPLSRIPLRVTH